MKNLLTGSAPVFATTSHSIEPARWQAYPDLRRFELTIWGSRRLDVYLQEATSKGSWLAVAIRVQAHMTRDQVSLVAAGLGFFALLAAFPAIAAAVSLYGLIASPADIADDMLQLRGFVPPDVIRLLEEQLPLVARQQNTTLSVATVLGIATSLWSARKGAVAAIQALNLAYNESESRSFIRQLGLTLVFTAGAVVYVIFATALVILLPFAIVDLGSLSLLSILAAGLQFVLLWLFFSIGLSVLYGIAPDRSRSEWHWFTWGSSIASILWVLGSAAFAFYTSHATGYQNTYGNVAGIVVMMLWLYFSGYLMILGAEINAVIEMQQSAVPKMIDQSRGV